MQEYKNSEILKRLYWKERLSTAYIAKMFHVSRDTIEYGWKRPNITKDLLEELYGKRKLSMPKWLRY